MAKRIGKFDSDLDAAIYELTLDGTDEECGDVTEIGWWGAIMRGGAELAGELADDGGLSSEDLAELRRAAGVIITEDEQGFVNVQIFTSEKALEKEWTSCLTDAEAAYEDEDVDDSGGGDEEYDSDYADE